MSLCDFNFKCFDTQKQKEFFNVETQKNENQSSPPNLEKQNDTLPNYHLNFIKSSSLFSNSNSNKKDIYGKIQSPLITRTQNVRRSFQGQVEAKYFNEQWNTFQQTSKYFIKMAREEKKQKLCQKKTQEYESNNSKKLYEVTILSLIIGYFVSMIYIIYKEIFF